MLLTCTDRRVYNTMMHHFLHIWFKLSKTFKVLYWEGRTHKDIFDSFNLTTHLHRYVWIFCCKSASQVYIPCTVQQVQFLWRLACVLDPGRFHHGRGGRSNYIPRWLSWWRHNWNFIGIRACKIMSFHCGVANCHCPSDTSCIPFGQTWCWERDWKMGKRRKKCNAIINIYLLSIQKQTTDTLLDYNLIISMGCIFKIVLWEYIHVYELTFFSILWFISLML